MKQNKDELENRIERQCNINKQLEEVCKMESKKTDECNSLISQLRADFIRFNREILPEKKESQENVLPHKNIIEDKFISLMRK